MIYLRITGCVLAVLAIGLALYSRFLLKNVKSMAEAEASHKYEERIIKARAEGYRSGYEDCEELHRQERAKRMAMVRRKAPAKGPRGGVVKADFKPRNGGQDKPSAKEQD